MKALNFIVVLVIVIVICASVFFNATPIGKAAWNNWFHDVQKADDLTNYETKKTVEDSCRAMVASYEADKLVWLQYKDSENSEERSWANQAMMRANRTAVTYNEYVLKNSYVWENNIPADILLKLEVVGVPKEE